MSYKFTDSIPYLLNRIGVRLGERFSARIAQYDVTLPMYRVLATLRQHGDQTLSELSEMVSVEMSTLSRLVGQLEKRGLLTRTRPEGNARIVRIDLTEDGVALAEKLLPIAAHFEQTAVGVLEPDEVEALKVKLRAINKNISEL